MNPILLTKAMPNTYQTSFKDCITINDHDYRISEEMIEKYLITSNNDIYDKYHYIIDLEDIPNKVYDNIICELLSGVSGAYINADPENELYYYIFVSKYMNEEYTKKLLFPRRAALYNGFSLIKDKSSTVSNEQLEIYTKHSMYTPEEIPGFGETMVRTDKDELSYYHRRGYVMVYDVYDVNNIDLIRCIFGEDKLDIVDTFIRNNKVRKNEIIYYGLL